MMSSAASTKIVKRYYTGRKKKQKGVPTVFAMEARSLFYPGEGTIFLSKKLL
jgi:hypothetical protein